MKSEEEIRKRVRDLKFRYLRRILRKDLKRRPHNCTFNREHTVQGTDGQDITVRLCMLGSEDPTWDIDICDTPKQAVCCPAYLPRRNRDDIEAEFEANLADPEWMRENHRDLYTLTWVLDTTETEYTWWQRLWLFWIAWRTPQDKALPDNGVPQDE